MAARSYGPLGRGLEPVVLGLARWGMRSLAAPPDDALALVEGDPPAPEAFLAAFARA